MAGAYLLNQEGILVRQRQSPVEKLVCALKCIFFQLIYSDITGEIKALCIRGQLRVTGGIILPINPDLFLI